MPHLKRIKERLKIDTEILSLKENKLDSYPKLKNIIKNKQKI